MAQTPLTWNGTDFQGNPLRWNSGLTWNGFVPQPQPKRMSQLRVLLGFASAADHSLEERATAVQMKLYGNPSYSTPPVTDTAPTIKEISNGMSGQLVVRVTPVANAKCYEVRHALIGTNGAPGAWQDSGLFTNSRAMAVGGLTPGGTYQFQVRAVGGSTGYSDWSDPVSHMSL